MSILIKGLEMPKENDYTIAIVYGDGVVTEYHEDYWIRGADGEKQLGIATPVPPHGDLIDYDFCMENYELLHDDDGYPVYAVRMRDINGAPTIIPAEEGE